VGDWAQFPKYFGDLIRVPFRLDLFFRFLNRNWFSFVLHPA